MNTLRAYNYIKVLSILGVLLAIYLLYQQIYQPEFRPCSINENINCDAIISGEVSKTLGLPTPLYGLLGYIGILAAAIFRKKNVLMGIATFGLAFCLGIAYIELVQLRVICPICIMCQLLMIGVFSFAIYIKRQVNENF